MTNEASVIILSENGIFIHLCSAFSSAQSAKAYANTELYEMTPVKPREEDCDRQTDGQTDAQCRQRLLQVFEPVQ